MHAHRNRGPRTVSVVAIALATTLQAPADITAKRDEMFSAKRHAAITVTLKSTGALSGAVTLGNGSQSGLCAEAFVAFVDSAGVVLDVQRATQRTCVNGSKKRDSDPSPVTRKVVVQMTVQKSVLARTRALRVRASEKACPDSASIWRLFP